MLPFVPIISHTNTSEPSNSKKHFGGKLYSICLTFCEAWRYQTFVAREHGRILVSQVTLRKVQLDRNPSEFQLRGIPGCTIDTKDKRTCLLAFLDIRNAISPCLRLCCMKNRIIVISFSHTCINKLEYENQHLFFSEKEGCTN